MNSTDNRTDLDAFDSNANMNITTLTELDFILWEAAAARGLSFVTTNLRARITLSAVVRSDATRL